MRTNCSSKSAKISARLNKKQTQQVTSRPKHSNEQMGRQREESGVQRADLFGLMKPKDVDEWIFGDQKIKVDCHSTTQNYQIRSRIAIHRKDRVTKHNIIEDKIKQKTTEQHKAAINYPPPTQQAHEKQNNQKTTARQYSKPLINRQQDNRNQLLEPNISKQFTPRYAQTAHSAASHRKLNNTNMEMYTELNQFLKPTAFSIELKKPIEYEYRTRSPKRDRMNKTIACSQKNNRQQMNKEKVGNFLRREFSVRTSALRKVESINNAQKQKFLLNGWQVEPPSFHEFDQLYRQKSRDLQKMPIDKQPILFKRKIVSMYVQ